ncbi:site-specific integrase [Clostridium sp.]|uniref:site-specific integrase n=1 Tax=Clostridium sp. TaxID=1506 RepID=UPI001A443F67|nr:site-specific integrase [Clostridium sp.]MBK5242392.1 tyrosine-type recombinase/integrase [Clostridium sp.]
MNETIKIEEAVSAVLAELERQRYSDTTIKSYRCNYNVLLKYTKEKGINYYSEQVGIDYLKEKYCLSINGFYGTQPKKISATMRCMQVLWNYTEYGKITFRMRGKDKPYECPNQFKQEYDAFNKHSIERKYAPQGFQAVIKPTRRFLDFLQYSNVQSSEHITSFLITKFLSNYVSNKTRYVATVISGLKNYMNFLYQDCFISEDISCLLPKVRIIRNSFIPSSWKTKDVKKLLESIDRGNPTGKRDYAILLTVVRLGLRVSDIRSLKLSNLNWNLKNISLIMQKTKQTLELPILEDVGWAIIDYLKNGRPETSSDILFIRHRAPYDAFSHNDCLQHSLHRYMVKAGIEIPRDRSCGLHSLRSTLARAMLDNNTPLPIISEVLGHQNIQTTSIYLKIDMEGLRKCIIDPDEVFKYEK